MNIRAIFQRMFRETLQNWDEMSYYERFEQLVAMLLSIAIAVTVVYAMYYLVVHVFSLLVVRTADPFDYRVFQAVFEMILTVLIAMEFNHTIVKSLRGEGSIIQVKIVLLIGILALVRKFIVMELETMDPWKVASLSLAVIALGGAYWLMRERDDRLAANGEGAAGREH